MYFDNHRDAVMRLEGTIITYRRKACIVTSVNEDLSLRLERMHDGHEFRSIKQTSKFVELKPPCLGYINTEGGAVYAMRVPARRWKQGLDTRAIRVGGLRLPFRASKPELSACLDGNYPTLEEARKMFVSTNPFKPNIPKSIAFSKRWAVSKKGRLLYKGNEVGEIKDEPMLSDKYIWLAEDLQETLNANH